MDTTQAIILALVQGITEFLPISSSAHLILVHLFAKWPDQGLAFDVALNTATLLAICIYLKRDLAALARGLFYRPGLGGVADRGFRGVAFAGRERRLVAMLLVSTLPAALSGLFFHDAVATSLRTGTVIAISSIFWGLVLWTSERFGGKRGIKDLGWGGAIFVGLAQAIALVPGTSRSGITITAGLFTGLDRSDAARFSFLLSIPIGVLAAANEAMGLINGGAGVLAWDHIVTGFIVAFVSAYLSVHLFLKFIERASLKPFVIYRVLLGIVILLFL